ncbi:MAG: TraB/GumN family protein [Thermodesulfobacteriota bacterium]
MTSTASSDVHTIELGHRQIILVGTAHVSQKSVDLVSQVIDAEQPDCVCVELDDKRYHSLRHKEKWQNLNIKEIIRKKQLATLMINLVLAAYQKKLGDQLGVKPGAELLAAAQSAEAQGIPIALCDRDVRVTLRRAWKSTSIFRKGYLLASLAASLFDKEEISEEKLSELKESDALSELLQELGTTLPEVKEVLIDERDTFLAEKIKAADGKKIVAVVGAGHVAGIKKALTQDRSKQMDEINSIPPVSPIWKTMGWLIPVAILASLGWIAYAKGGAAAGDSAIYWVLANGIPSSLGALIAFCHPATILTAFVAAPITSLTPVIGAGYVCAFTQAMVRPPLVQEFETAMADMTSFKGWWHNNLLKVFLAFLLPAMGSTIGTWVGGYGVFTNLS